MARLPTSGAIDLRLPWYYWETTVINHRTGVEELSSRTDRTTPFTMDWPNVSFAT
jgi:hypothetical protein